MRLRATISALVLAAAAAACADTDVTNPNQPSTTNFWKTEGDALLGINAVYGGITANGVYGRWLNFPLDIRSDIGRSSSPWTDLANWSKFNFTAYDVEFNSAMWSDHYRAIYRANQVIANVPGIAMDTALASRVVGEAKFLRGTLYFNLAVLFGGGIPVPLDVPEIATRPESLGTAGLYAQIQKDLTEAAAALPPAYAGGDVGRATQGAARAMLGKVLLQQRKWADAAAALAPLVAGGRYQLMPNYADNFNATENNAESVFEVQFGDRTQVAAGVRGLNLGKFLGPCGPSFCDGEPTTWFFTQFLVDSTAAGQVDPRLDVTLFYNKPGGQDVFGQPFATRYRDRLADPKRIAAGDSVIFFKKYTEYYLPVDQDFDAAVNYRVIRFADVLLMYAEALNEQGQTAAALPFVNRVRARPSVNVRPLPGGLTQAQMRDRILHERVVELGNEGSRWLDLARQNLLTPAGLPTLRAHDAEFALFTPNKAELLPIPNGEINLNSNIRQNVGW